MPYTLDRVAQPTPNAAWGVAEQIAAATPTQPDGKALRVRRQIYPVDGTDQDWMRHTHGTVAFIVEGSHHNPEVRDVRLASVAALRPIVPTLLDRVLDGPTLRVRVLDGAGEPVPDALVHIEQDQPKAGERWTTGADGRHDRVLAPGIGRVRVTVTHPDGRQATASTTVTGRTPLDVVFPDP